MRATCGNPNLNPEFIPNLNPESIPNLNHCHPAAGSRNPTELESPHAHVPAFPHQELPGTDLKARTRLRGYTRLSRFAPPTENLSTENPTVTVVGLDQGTFNFVRSIAAWEGHGAAPFTTTQVRDLAAVLCSQNLLEIFAAGRAATDAVPQIRVEVVRLETELEDQKADFIQQQMEIARLTRSLDLPLDAVNAGPPSSSRSQDIASPDKFSKDRRTYRSFKAQLQKKLMGDAGKFRDDQHKMMYITSLLEGNAHRMIYPYILNNLIDFNTIKELWDILDCAYDDPDHQGTAERELAMLKQRTKEFSAYFGDFQRIMAELKWNPSAKKAALRQGRAGNLKDVLLSYDCPDDWLLYMRLLQRLASKVWQREAETKKEPTNTPSRATQSSLATPSPTAHVTSNLAYHGPAPMCDRQLRGSWQGWARAGLELGWTGTRLGSDKAGDKAWLGILFILKSLREEERKERKQQREGTTPS